MICLFLLGFMSFISASQEHFSLTLADKNGQDQTISLDEASLGNFEMLQNLSEATRLSDQHGSKISNQQVSFEIFTNILQPLCEELKKSDYPWQSVSLNNQSEVANAILYDTKLAIKWIYSLSQKPALDDIVSAYHAANFLQMTFAGRRALVNYLYDHDCADRVLNYKELTENKSGLLISNKEISEIRDTQLDSLGASTNAKRKFEDEEIRFFDVNYFCKWLPTTQTAEPEKDDLFLNFSKNKIKKINFAQLYDCINYLRLKGITFSFCENSLDNETMQYIKSHDVSYLQKKWLNFKDALSRMQYEKKFNALLLGVSSLGAGLLSRTLLFTSLGKKWQKGKLSLASSVGVIGMLAWGALLGASGLRKNFNEVNVLGYVRYGRNIWMDESIRRKKSPNFIWMGPKFRLWLD